MDPSDADARISSTGKLRVGACAKPVKPISSARKNRSEATDVRSHSRTKSLGSAFGRAKTKTGVSWNTSPEGERCPGAHPRFYRERIVN